MNKNHSSKTFFFDKIQNGTVIPNGLTSNKLIDIYLNDLRKYKDHYHLRTPHFFEMFSLKYDILSEKSKGLYALEITNSSILTECFCNYLVEECISGLAKKKIINKDLKLLIYVYLEGCREHEFYAIYNALCRAKLDNFLIYTIFLPSEYTNNSYMQERVKLSHFTELHMYVKYNVIWRGPYDSINYNNHKKLRGYALAYSNRHNYDFKLVAFYYLIKKGLHKYCLLSNNKNIPIRRIVDSSNFNKIIKNKDFFTTIKHNTYSKLNHDDLMNLDINLVLECYLDDYNIPYPLITEKTFRPIAFKQLFIIIGQKHSLKKLKEKGYKTFSPNIDESYDDIEDNDLRLTKALLEFERLLLMPEKDFICLKNDLKNIINFNYEHFIKNCKQSIEELNGNII